jgi:hypothetical protein
VRRPAFGTGFRSGFASRKRLRGSFFGGLPALDQGADVALENFGQIVVAVELVLVGDAGKALDGLGDGHVADLGRGSVKRKTALSRLRERGWGRGGGRSAIR